MNRFIKAVAIVAVAGIGTIGTIGTATAASAATITHTETITVVDHEAWTETITVTDKEAWTETITVTDKKAWTETITVTDKKAWTETVPAKAAVWANFSPTEPGKFTGTPTYPTDPGGTWHEKGALPPGHEGVDGVYQKGGGNGSWFYREGVIPAYDIPHAAETHDVVVEHAAVTHDVVVEHAAVTHEETITTEEPTMPEGPTTVTPTTEPETPTTESETPITQALSVGEESGSIEAESVTTTAPTETTTDQTAHGVVAAEGDLPETGSPTGLLISIGAILTAAGIALRRIGRTKKGSIGT